MLNFCQAALFSLLMCLSAGVPADERILSFHSDVTVYDDGSMRVTETIKVRAEQDRIKRGIYRDFPTLYTDRYGNTRRVDFTPVMVLRNGKVEYHSSIPIANGIRTYIGRESVILEPGLYTYNFTYTVGRQIGFFQDHDELYWNVTGNGWEFPIDRASVRIYLPASVGHDTIRTGAWTGDRGSTARDYREDRYNGGHTYIETTTALAPQQGLTVVISWPKGHVSEPSTALKLEYFFQDYRPLIIGAAGLTLVLVYYLFCWLRFGKDPDAGVVVPLYQPPAGFSPASLRFIRRMGYDRVCFAAALINLAVKGHLKISEQEGTYTLEKTGKTVDMSPGETALSKKLFSDTNKRILHQASHQNINAALKAHQSSLQHDYEKLYFVTNRNLFLGGLAFTLLALGAAIVSMNEPGQRAATLFASVWLSIWTLAVFYLIKSALAAWRNVRGVGGLLGALHLTVFAAVFTAAEIGAIYLFSHETRPFIWILILAGALINWAFYEWLKAPTLVGSRLLNRTEGFRHYLEVAEKQELARRHLGGRNPELFEKYLPYALALGIEQQWAEKFSDVLTKVSGVGVAYHPAWYSGAAWDHNHIGGFASSLGHGFTGAIAAASTAPGSVSAGGGGGSSGGGGGGGGGGGW